MIIIQPSASRTTNPRVPIPSSKLLGYYHSSALRTDNSIFHVRVVGLLLDYRGWRHGGLHSSRAERMFSTKSAP